MTEEEFKVSIPVPETASVYRQVHLQQLDKIGRFPKASHFFPDPDGLSVNWDEFSNPDHVYHIIGISYKKDQEVFKNCRDFKVVKLPIIFLRSIEGIEDVIHSPIYQGDPATIGFPNIYCHASVLYGQEDEETRIKLSTYCAANQEICDCNVDLDKLEEEIKLLREKLDQTAFHRLQLM